MIKFKEAIRRALQKNLKEDNTTYLFGLGVNDANRVFGTTASLVELYGEDRVFEIPISENTLTGFAIGLGMQEFKSILVHARADFSYVSAEQIINQAAKISYMTNGEFNSNLTIRMVVGRGWGQGANHAQSPHSVYAQIPGLEIYMPATPNDAFQLLCIAIKSPNPVIFIEHRWLFETEGEVDEINVDLKDRNAHVIKKGNELTLIASSYMTIEALKVATILEKLGKSIEIVNLRVIRPLDKDTILSSADKTGRIAILDISQKYGLTSEISSLIYSNCGKLKDSILEIGLKDEPVPSSSFLSYQHYPNIKNILTEIRYHFKLDFNLTLAIKLAFELYPQVNEYNDQPPEFLIKNF